MRFEAAWIWLLAPPLLAYLLWLALRSYAQLSRSARWASLLARALVVLLALGAISRPALLRSTSGSQVVFLLDVSRSVSADNIDAAMEETDRLIRAALRESGVRVSVAAFGQNATLLAREATTWDGWPEDAKAKIRHERALPELIAERTKKLSAGLAADSAELKALGERIAGLEKFRTQVVGDFTDAEQALRLGLNCGTTEQRRTVYLLTDGNFNRGAVEGTPAGVAASGAAVHLVVLDRPAPPEVCVSEVAAPASVRVDQGFSADVCISSTTASSAELRVFKDGFLHREQKVELKPGRNVVKVPGLFVKDKGFHAIEATVRADADTQAANNTARSIVTAPGEARILYIDRDMDQTPYLKSALELEGIQVEARSAAGVPQQLTELLGFDALVLCNVAADRLSLRQMQMIRSYVQDFGGGFAMLGGDESFGLGGYYNTPIEEILPVRMPIQKDMLRPSLALMLVIDKSGSMDGVKIQLAKRAAIATAEAINPRDLIGVIGFDGQSRVLLELTPAADRTTIAGAIGQLDAGGGTFLYPALEDAHERLAGSSARRKHVIVLSDGQTQGYGYEDLVGNLAADSISLSAIGIGEGADMRLMEAIASAGGGRAYFTNDYQSIPQIFTREALRASKSMLVERLVQPNAINTDPALDEIDVEELPVLTGYVATTPKSAARTLIVSDTGDPILAKWRFGLGRTAAFTSEPKPRWAEDWVEWEDFAKFWSQLVRSITGRDLTSTMQVTCGHNVRGDAVHLTADVRDMAGAFADAEVELTSVSGGKTRVLDVRRAGAGLYEATLPGLRFGEDQQFLWRVNRKTAGAADSQPATRSTTAPTEHDDGQLEPYAFANAFSPEFAATGPSTETVERFRTRRLGEVASVGSSKFVAATSTVRSWLTLWPSLLIAAVLLVPLDILIRRLG
ncbi:MAG: VWA domain-containing protein [Planctomycetes bacterium]|nr:VWA domain-containing protein [Planctomycetota bacterium]